MAKFREMYPHNKRHAEACRIIAKYPHRIPIIVETALGADLPVLEKRKYLVPRDLSLGQFGYVLMKRMHLTPEKALFLFVDNLILPTASLMDNVYEEHKNIDLFLYIILQSEETFGK